VGEAVIVFPIETERLVIRPLRLDDAADLAQPESWIREKVDRFARDAGMSLWAAVERESGRAVALAGLQWEEIDGRRELDIGCVVAAHARQRGYATEASLGVLAAAAAAGYERITAMTLPDNAAAMHVLAKLGFERRGETLFDGRRYTFFVKGGPDSPAGPRASAEASARPGARS
jgi:RimJ/RimL family protein N-acetyltransferase